MVTSTKRLSDLSRVDASLRLVEDSTHSPESRFVNRELSWIQFNSRVLSLAADRALPLLERVRFLSIFTSNLDEFFMKRVGGLNRQVAAGISTLSPDGSTPRQQLAAIRKALLPLLAEQQRIFSRDIRPALLSEGIEFVHWNDLTRDERTFAGDYFQSKVFPLLTPFSVDAGHPFPFLSNLSISLGFTLTHHDASEPLFARVKISGNVPQWIQLPSAAGHGAYRFLSMQDLVVKHAQELFPAMTITSSMPFRITRNIDLEVDDEDAEDLMEAIEEELRQRRVGEVVRLEHNPNPDPWICNFLVDELQLGPEDIFELDGLLDFTGLNVIADLDIPKLRFTRWVPTIPSALTEEGSMFSLIRARDLMVHHPYESFAATVERFVREAAADPKVLSIKMTLYRIGEATPLINALIRAAEDGKQVVCLVELKARFDEKQNIHWAQQLEKAGVHVMYGIPGLKIHSKATLVIRQDADGVRAYAHCGTGNYHSRTATLYTDVGLFTAKPEFTRDMIYFFNYLTGRSLKDDYGKILVAPLIMERAFISLIQREARNQREGLPSGIIAKMNALEDRDIIEALYAASDAGVPIDLIVRGACSLRPCVPGLSDEIRVLSVVGRFLEHSRIYYFRNAAVDPIDGLFYIGSADWMGRNLHRRVEVCIPVEERSLRERLWQILGIMLSDQKHAWDMQADGTYHRRSTEGKEALLGTHETLMALSASLPRST
ncbi:MAG: polyphosphate kinase 1 [Deltaproteobacteria bacterium]|nr:polyphosphate kinase 1 [Deltaproteobacteria bacterium]